MENTNLYKEFICWLWYKTTKRMIKAGFGSPWMKNYIDTEMSLQIRKKLSSPSN